MEQNIDIPEDFLCPITQELMEDLVIAADGHSYQREAISKWLQTGRIISPLTGERLQDRVIKDNITLKKIIKSFKDKIPQIQINQAIKVDLDMAIELREKFISEFIEKKEQQNQFLENQVRKLEKQLAQKNSLNNQQNNEIHIKIYPNGDKYEGEYKDGKKHGKGTYYYASGSKYEGEWKDGNQHGKGTYYYANGNKYEGEWKDDKKHGKGTFYYANGGKYEGEYKDGKKHGKGTFYYANGGKYEGEWKDDKRNEKGTFYYANGEKYEGEWKDDNQHGKGTYYYANGEKYEGEWKDDKFHGKGIFYYANGNKYEGEWKDGQYQRIL